MCADSAVRTGCVVGEPVTRRRHPERTEQHLVGEILPRFTGAHRDRLGTRGQPKVGVGVRDSERVEWQLPESFEHVPPVVAEVLQQVACVVGQPRAVREHVPHADHRRDSRIRQREPWQLGHDRCIPADRVGAHLMGDHGCAQRLGHRCQLEHRVRVDLGAIAHILDPEALGVHGLPAMNHGDGHPGDAGLLHQVVDDPVELGHRRVDRVVGQRHRGHQRRWHVCLRLGRRRWRLVSRFGVAAPYQR